jgi:hypothetical protein
MWMALTAVIALLSGCSTTELADKPATGNPVVRLEVISLRESSSQQAQSSGSGFFVTRDGYLVSNDHVVHPIVEGERCKTQSVKIRINPGERDERVLTGETVAFDQAADIALVKVPGSRNRPTLQLAQPGTLQAGSPVHAQGYPLGGPYKETSGTVIGVLPADARRPTGIVFCTAEVKPGNSGGPVLDQDGKVVAVAVAISNVELLKAFKQVQDAAASGLAQMMEAMAQASAKMKADGDKDGYGSQFDAMIGKGKATLKEHAERSWILEEATKNPNKTHAIDVADVRQLLAKWHIPVDDQVAVTSKRGQSPGVSAPSSIDSKATFPAAEPEHKGASVEGTLVRPRTGEPIPGQTVFVCVPTVLPDGSMGISANAILQQTKTDADGRFRLSNLPVGKRIMVTVTDSNGSFQFVTLTTGDIKRLGEVFLRGDIEKAKKNPN